MKQNDIIVESCPFCGNRPILKEHSLDYGNGHGYPGHYDYWFECPCCEEMKGQGVDDIYGTRDTAKERAAQYWNTLVERQRKRISKLSVPKEELKDYLIGKIIEVTDAMSGMQPCDNKNMMQQNYRYGQLAAYRDILDLIKGE